jgi:Protoglobin
MSNLAGGDLLPMGLPDVSGDLNPLYDEFDDDSLYKNLQERVRYLTHFIGFTDQDVEALNDFQPILLPIVDQLVDNVYHQLFRFDITKQVFMPRKGGEEGRMMSDLHDLALDAPQIEMRKKTFAVYMRKLVTSDYNDFATWQYFGAFHI